MSENIKWGLTHGLTIACGLSVLVVLEYLVLGAAPFSRIGVPIGTVIGLYFATGVLCGALVGVLRPWTTSLLGSTVVGAITGLLLAGLIMVGGKGTPDRWDGAQWFSVLVGGPLLGGYAAVRFSTD